MASRGSGVPAIELRGLGHEYGAVAALNDVNLTVPAGTIYGYLGLNGAGKSTTIRILATLMEPTRGRVAVLGIDPVRQPLEVWRLVGLVSDDAQVPNRGWTPYELLDYFATARGLYGSRGHADRLFDMVGLDVKARRRPMGSLSTGMKRRVDLARALLGSPKVLFLDEPTQGLDLPGRHDVWRLLRSLVDRYKITVFLSSHDGNEIQALCDRVAVLRGGRIVYDGETRRLGTGRQFEATLVRLLEG